MADNKIRDRRAVQRFANGPNLFQTGLWVPQRTIEMVEARLQEVLEGNWDWFRRSYNGGIFVSGCSYSAYSDTAWREEAIFLDYGGTAVNKPEDMLLRVIIRKSEERDRLISLVEGTFKTQGVQPPYYPETERSILNGKPFASEAIVYTLKPTQRNFNKAQRRRIRAPVTA